MGFRRRLCQFRIRQLRLFLIILFLLTISFIVFRTPGQSQSTRTSRVMNSLVSNRTNLTNYVMEHEDILDKVTSKYSRTNLGDYVLRQEVSLDKMKSKYSTEEYGLGMFKRWSSSRIDVCSPLKNDSGQGHVFCYERKDFEQPRMLCVLEKAQIRMRKPFYSAKSLTVPEVTPNANVIVRDGILRINCDSSVFKQIPKDFRKTALSAFLQEIPTSSPIPIQCSTWVNHTVFWMNRYDHRNAYHFMEDVVTTFQSLIVLEEDPEDVELAIYDGYPTDNALFTIWPKLVGKGVRVVRQSPFPKNTCFRRSISNMFAVRSHLTNNRMYNRDTDFVSPILLGLREWILDRLGLQSIQRTDSSKIKIVFISRQHLKDREIKRIIQNEPEIIEGIRTAYPQIDLLIFQPENFKTFKEQIEQVLDADVLIGVHGAGLMHSLFMSPGSTLIEIFMDDWESVNRHFHNIATWVGLNYESIGHFTSNVELEPLIRALNKTLESRKYRNRELEKIMMNSTGIGD